MTERVLAKQVVESLRKGLPPTRGVELYSVGNEKLIAGTKRFHLADIGERGVIRFVSGSWGAGKTHFFRQLRETAFAEGCLVSTVELNVDEAPLNKFEKVFYSIVRNIASPSLFHQDLHIQEVAPFGRVVWESLCSLGGLPLEHTQPVPYENLQIAVEKLMADNGIDIDFRKIVRKYWETFLPEGADPAAQQQLRSEILQWFAGEGTRGTFSKNFGVSKIVGRENAKLMLQSLANFIRLSGYRGLLILFDEAEQAYSILRKSALKDAHNNLLSLINNIDGIPGLFLLYATTPDFYVDPKHGIIVYGALSQRIGRPEDRPPRALDTIWNLDSVSPDLDTYRTVGRKVKEVYTTAYSEAASDLPSDGDVDQFVAELYTQHPSLAAIGFWRVLTTGLIAHFDDCMEGDSRPVRQVYHDVMERLRED